MAEHKMSVNMSINFTDAIRFKLSQVHNHAIYVMMMNYIIIIIMMLYHDYNSGV